MSARMLLALLWAIALAAALPARAQEERVVAGLSRDRVSITTNFDGSEILIFGAVRRETPEPAGGPLQVIVTVEGPSERVTVRRKSRVFGIWVNAAAVEVDSAPSFYAVASSAPLASVLSDTEDLRHRVSIARAIRSVGAPGDILDSQAFTRALIRLRRADTMYQEEAGNVSLAEATLFSTSVALPANIIEGDYRVRIFLTRDRRVIDRFETVIGVHKVGIERWLFALSGEWPLAYGVLALVLAAGLGWGASALFRLLRS